MAIICSVVCNTVDGDTSSEDWTLSVLSFLGRHEAPPLLSKGSHLQKSQKVYNNQYESWLLNTT